MRKKLFAAEENLEELVLEELGRLEAKMEADDIFLQTKERNVLISMFSENSEEEVFCTSDVEISADSSCFKLFRAVNTQQEGKKISKELDFLKVKAFSCVLC